MKVLLPLAFSLLVAGCALAQCPASQQWVSVSPNKCMRCSIGRARYEVAKIECEMTGGNLASILNANEEAFANGCSTDLGVTAVWMGLIMRTNGSTVFGWLDGSPETVDELPDGVTADAPDAFLDGCFLISEGMWEESDSCTELEHFVCSRVHVTCPPLTPPGNSSVTSTPAAEPYYTGNVATYTCNTGYSMTAGSATRMCNDLGFWDGGDPTCSPVNCGPLFASVNGQVKVADTTYNSRATYTCNTGYTLGNSSATTVCQANQTWSGVAAACTAVTCGVLVNPADGAVSTSGITYESTATYSCNDGYDMDGGATRTCTETGVWSGAAPSCSSTVDGSDNNTLPIALGASLGGLALLSIGGLIYSLARTSGPAQPNGPKPTQAPNRLTPAYPRPAAYRGTPAYPRPGLALRPIRPPLRPVGMRLY